MLSKKVCTKCEYCEGILVSGAGWLCLFPEEINGEIVYDGVVLNKNSDITFECPYALEHIIGMQNNVK